MHTTRIKAVLVASSLLRCVGNYGPVQGSEELCFAKVPQREPLHTLSLVRNVIDQEIPGCDSKQVHGQAQTSHPQRDDYHREIAALGKD